jgi:hypothetical protein
VCAYVSHRGYARSTLSSESLFGAGKGFHELTPSRILARGRLSRDSDDHSLRLYKDLLNRCQAARLTATTKSKSL